MSESSDADDLMRYSFLVVFANDRTIDEHELAFIEKIALRDNRVDDDERRVLHNIFSRVNQDDVTPGVWEEIQRFKAKYDID